MMLGRTKVTLEEAMYSTVAARRDINFQLYWQAASIGFAAQALLLVEIVKSRPLAGAALSLASLLIGLSMIVLGRSQKRHQLIESAWLDLFEAESGERQMLHAASVSRRARQVQLAMQNSSSFPVLQQRDSFQSIHSLVESRKSRRSDATWWFMAVQHALAAIAGIALLGHVSQIPLVHQLAIHIGHYFETSFIQGQGFK